MLNANSPPRLHTLQNIAIILLSIFVLPLTTSILFLSYNYRRYLLHSARDGRHLHAKGRQQLLSTDSSKPKMILVTGVGMTKGLVLARLFYQAGHDVVAADFEPGESLVCGRVSEAVRKFYRLTPPPPPPSSATSKTSGGMNPYVKGLLEIVEQEQVDLWVSCSGVASAVEDGIACEIIESRTACKAVQFDEATTKILHEKGSFIERVKQFGLPVPHTVEVTSRQQVWDVLVNAPEGRKYILKTVGVDDSVRGDMTLLPKVSEKETRAHITSLKIDPATPWIVQQFIDGLEFCTHSLIVRGEVRAFVACPSAELLMHYSSLPSESPLSQAMLNFTREFAVRSGKDFTGHLSFDFLVEYDHLNREDPAEITLYPIECNPRAHTAVALFNGTTALSDAYMSILDPGEKPSYADVVDPTRKIVTPVKTDEYYWTGHDLVTLLIIPILDLLRFRITIGEFIGVIDLLLDHLLTWKDGTFELWDPFPWWWLYHIYWPFRCWNMLIQGRRWSRVNVSTGKMFEC